MIAIYHERPEDPEAAAVRKALQALETRTGDAFKANERLYKRYRDLLMEIFHNKCAYCEVSLMAKQKPTIEHFRPKGKVTDSLGKTICDSERAHNGYRWLVYEWGNLLPACDVCNSTYKRNYFPVAAKHAFSAGDHGSDPH